jgi:hypothetical protein
VSFEPPFPPPEDVPPAAPPPPLPGLPTGGGTAWDRRDQIGLVNALVETTQAVLLRPREFFEGMPVTGGVGGPLLYALILGYLGLVATTVYNLVFNSIIGTSLSRFGGDRPVELERLLELYGTWGGAIGQLVVGPVWIVVAAFLGAGIFHLVLMLTGGAHRDFEATFRVVAFGHAVNVLGLLPFCGGLAAVVWWLVVATVGLSVVHRISTGQALVAVLLPAFVCCCCCLGVLGLLASTLAGLIGQLR